MTEKRDYYQVLGINKNASPAENQAGVPEAGEKIPSGFPMPETIKQQKLSKR